MIQQVEFNTKNVNPFYGMKNTLEIYQDGSKGVSISNAKLEAAWKECKNNEQLAVLFSVLFFIGDVTNRQHNIFEDTEVDGGGNSQREVFRDNIIPFLVSKVKKLSKKDRLTLINLIVEYTTLDNVVSARVKTKKGTKTVVSVIDMISIFGVDDIASYVSEIIRKGDTFKKICVAKFVTRPRFSKRAGKSEILPQTVAVHTLRASLLKAISDKAKLPYEDKGTYINFSGFYEWRKEYNKDFESVLFSSKEIEKMDKEQFIKFIDSIPSDARFRVRNRVMFSDKWTELKQWYTEWEKYKESKQAEQRKLQNQIDQNGASEELVAQLAKVKKEAKVNVGANSFTQLFTQIVNGTVDEIKLQPFLDKINLPYNSLIFMDDSGSMSWGSSGLGFKPFQFAAFMATICMMKNPDSDARNLIGLFSNDCRMYNGITSQTVKPNSLMVGKTIGSPKTPLINPEDKFLTNLNRMSKWLNGTCVNGATYVTSIPDGINKWAGGNSEKLEELMKYPVWTIISDGNFNNSSSVEASMNEFMRKCQIYFGFKPFVILIDVAVNSAAKITRFSGIDNVMIVPPNPAAIEMLLTNFKDMDTYDVYTPLLSLSRSSRYAPVRKFVESSLK